MVATKKILCAHNVGHLRITSQYDNLSHKKKDWQDISLLRSKKIIFRFLSCHTLNFKILATLKTFWLSELLTSSNKNRALAEIFMFFLCAHGFLKSNENTMNWHVKLYRVKDYTGWPRSYRKSVLKFAYPCWEGCVICSIYLR